MTQYLTIAAIEETLTWFAQLPTGSELVTTFVPPSEEAERLRELGRSLGVGVESILEPTEFVEVVAAAGLAIDVVTPDELNDAIDTLLGDADLRARLNRIGADIRQRDGLTKGADIIEQVLRDQGIRLPDGYDPHFDNPIGEVDAAAVAGLSHRTLQEARRTGNGPPYLQLTPGEKGKVGYTRRGLIVWRQHRIRRSTAEAASKRP